jgi:hypothetical protein
MIFLDGFPYYVDRANYSDTPTTFSSSARGLTGQLLVVDSGIAQQHFTIQLNVNQRDSENLKASFAKCHAGVFLDFVDERNIAYLVATGTDIAKSKYFSTGVWLESLSEPKPATEALFDPALNTWFSPYKRFIVTIQLTVNSTVLV